MSRWLIGCFLVCGCFTGVLFSQDFASLTVTVTDSTDAMVPDASVTLVNSQRGTIYHQQTPTGGYVIFDSLTPGDYSVQIEKTGFQQYQIRSLTMGVRDRKTLVVELKVAAAQSTAVDVKEKVDLISNDTAQGVPLGQNYIQNLPTNGRNAESLVLMAPGISTSAGGIGDGGINANGQTYTVAAKAQGETAAAPVVASASPGVTSEGPEEVQADTVPPAALDAAESLAIVSGEAPEAVEETQETKE